MKRQQPRRVTGTSVYTLPRCEHAVALDLFADRGLRRPWTPVEEMVLRRGRELEAQLTAPLGYSTPTYAEGDDEAGAAATLELMRAGVPGVLQGVLRREGRLGIPDLLRREEGASALGAHHFVVGDVKSSRRARSDQILQVMFYSRLLAATQDRQPEYAYLLLRGGQEERFACADYDAVLDDVEQRLAAIRGGEATRPFLSAGCGSCPWSAVCLPALEADDDLSLLEGMTRGLRRTLEGAGIRRCAELELAAVEPLARRTHLDVAQLRRLKKAAAARAGGRPIPAPRAADLVPAELALVHLLEDPFAERVYWIGVLHPATAEGRLHEALPSGRERELTEFLALLEQVPPRVPLWHFGSALPRWYDEVGWRRRGGVEVEGRMVDLARRLRGAASYPAPVFGLDGYVEQLLRRDPHRAGDSKAVALWVAEPDGRRRLVEKGRSDLRDLAELVAVLRGGWEIGSVARATAG